MAQVPARPGQQPQGTDWTASTADTVERVVGSIRDKTAVPLTTVARAAVYGQIASVMGIAALVLVTIVVIRLGSSYLGGPLGNHAGRSVWVTEGALGLLFVVLGSGLLKKANADRSDAKR